MCDIFGLGCLFMLGMERLVRSGLLEDKDEGEVHLWLSTYVCLTCYAVQRLHNFLAWRVFTAMTEQWEIEKKGYCIIYLM